MGYILGVNVHRTQCIININVYLQLCILNRSGAEKQPLSRTLTSLLSNGASSNVKKKTDEKERNALVSFAWYLVAACTLTALHRLPRPNKTGYGFILGQA